MYPTCARRRRSRPGLKDSTIANNDFYSGGGPNSVNLQVDFSPGHANNLVVDNIFYQVGRRTGAVPHRQSGRRSRPRGTAAPAGSPSSTTTGSTAADRPSPRAGRRRRRGRATSTPTPISAEPRDHRPGRLTSSSPARPTSMPASRWTAWTTDYYGVPRPQGKAPDIGAHEVVTTPPPPAAVPPPPGVPPGVPTGLAATSPSPYEIDLTWGDYVAPLAGFDIQRRGNGDWIPLGYGAPAPATAPSPSPAASPTPASSPTTSTPTASSPSSPTTPSPATPSRSRSRRPRSRSR